MKLPARIGKYELERYLGGGMSEVYQARDTVLGRTVAVKLLTAQGGVSEDVRTRFLLEARVSSGIAHENVITTYDYGEEDGMPYMVLEFLTGQTLKEALQTGENIPLKRRVSIALQLARALAYVHSKNLIHRDIKPDNVHLDKAGRVKLMDFGIVKTGDVNLTQAGYALGTPHYVAPELVMGLPVTPLVDVYSYGVLLYELLTGKRAIQADTVERIFYLILHEEIPFEPMAAAGVPEPLQEIVKGAIARDPALRTQSMETIATQLENWIDGVTTKETAVRPVTVAVPAPAPRPKVRLSNTWLACAAGVALLVAAGLVYTLVYSNAASARELVRLADHAGDMILIPAGPFLYGPGKQKLDLPAFYMDITEVSNEDYEEFCTATGHALPPGYERGKPGYPVVNVTIEDAKAFAKWAGKRLPTEKEWQKAARGDDGRAFPWGNERKAGNANVSDNSDGSLRKLVSADAFRHGRSPFLIVQLVGNVRELTGEQTAPTVTALRACSKLVDPPATADEPWYLVKGGSFNYKLDESEAQTLEIIPGRYRSPDLGFRCAKDP